MEPTLNNAPVVTAVKGYFAVAILFLILSIVVIYYSRSVDRTARPNTGPTQESAVIQDGAVVSDAEKYKMLDQISQKTTPGVLTDSDKLKLLESLK